MIRRRLNYVAFVLRLVTLLLPLAAFVIAGYVRFFSKVIPVHSFDFDPAAYFGLLLFATFVWAIVSEYYAICHLDQIFAARGKTRRMLSACVVTYAAVMAATFFYRTISFSRLFILLSAGALLMLLAFSRIVFRAFLDNSRQRGRNCVRVLILGADQFAERVARSILCGQVMPCIVVGFVRLPDQQIEVSGSPVFELEDMEKLGINNGIDDVVIAMPPNLLREIPAVMAKLETLCVPVRAILDLGEGVEVREQLFDFGGVLMLDLQTTPAESVTYFVLKRAFDIIFSAFVILVAGPLILLISLAIKLSSPGPVLFAQDRVGLNGKVFRMYKFRTMRVGDPAESDTRWTTADDPRCTKLGKFLRRANLDELPQFFNVLKGEMSVVGPRPERPYFVQKFLQDVAKYNSRHYLKVGITGWAQVNGWRGDTPIPQRVEYDLYYLRNWSLTFDLQIILLTFWRAFSGRNAY